MSLIPEKNHGFSEGITTRDLILIQRHILGKETLDSPYQRIAADVNGDGSINAFDLLELRQLVLNPDGVLADNKSGRFYEQDSQREVYEITDVRGDKRVEFVGVKFVDVDMWSDPAST